MTDKNLYIIDGHALVFKMYYALLGRPMLTSKGMDTSILFGFTKYLFELRAKRQPDYMVMCFDPAGGTFRNELYPEYKANRGETPQLVIDALEPLCKICTALRIPVLMEKGYEADDVAGTIAKAAEKEGFTVYLVTPDKDYGQLISPKIFQYKPGKKGGDDEILGVREVCEKYGIDSPSQVIDILTICGDTSDNVPGVKGVGEVGASKLLKTFGSVKNIYDNLDQLTPRQKDLFEQARDHIELSHQLVTIKTDVPVKIDFEQMKVTDQYRPEIVTLFDEYEFHSLKKHICHIHADEAVCRSQEIDTSYALVEASVLAAEARKAGLVAVAGAADSGLAFATNGTKGTLCCFVPLAGSADPLLTNAPGIALPEALASVLSDTAVAVAGFDLKALMRSGLRILGKRFDIELIHYLVNPERSHKVEVLSMEYLGIDLQDKPEAQTGDLFAEEESESSPQERFCMEAVVSLFLKDKMLQALAENHCEALYNDIEEPLIGVLADMEQTGVKVELGPLRDFAQELREEATRHEQKAREMTGEPELNCASPKQVGIVLYEKLKINPKARPSNGRYAYPTDEDTLSLYADRFPVINEILEFRAAKKLLSSYIEPFPTFISPKDGRIHTTFNQALTATGRLSSSKPNLQNIPIRTERGQNIRKAFVSDRPDGLIVSADYSQIELRIMAHLCGDEHLRKAFNTGEDVHRATAAKIFGIPTAEVTDAQRRLAKTANFGIMYGISGFGLAQRLGIGRSEAQQLIKDYFATFPAIADFMEKAKREAVEKGYVETIFGRRRYLPELKSRNASARGMAERNAINAPIQGSSADIIKLAMIKVDEILRTEGFKSKMILQIHDELLFDAYPDEVEALQAKVKEAMENIVQLSVPLEVECGVGVNWFEAH
ncbi:MAG: DNA polymerase I [Bacteroidales bacterium]|nr:DNA polymerase I [Bacteroidales bacterium]